MAVLVGIDEAGFGPLLGPLVVSSSSFSLPCQLLNSDLWQILEKSVGKTRKHLAGRLLITDSKKAYNKSIGIKNLERTVLTVLKYLSREPSDLNEIMELLCPVCLERLNDYPWYGDFKNSHIFMDVPDRAIASDVFANDLASNGIKLLDVRSSCLDVAHYNEMVEAVKNKSNVLFTAICQLIKRAYDNFAVDDLQIIVDRQGGRVHYRKNLQRMFPAMNLKILREDNIISSYELHLGEKAMRIHFVVGADQKYLPVSLASMVSKYLRELLIGNINKYFTCLGEGLKPTAGYWKDGMRFVEDLKNNFPHIQFDSKQLIRCR